MVRRTSQQLLGVLFATVLAQGQGFYRGTAEVILVSPDAIAAAADSKEIYSEYRDGKITSSESTTCKGTEIGPHYAMFAGMARSTDGFSALSELRLAWSDGLTINEFVSRIETSIPERLTASLHYLAGLSPELTRPLGAELLQVAVFGFENGHAAAALVRFVSEDGSIKARVSLCPGNCQLGRIAYLLGAHEASEVLARGKPRLMASATSQSALELLQAEYLSRPDIVGGPPLLITFDRSGRHTIQSGACNR